MESQSLFAAAFFAPLSVHMRFFLLGPPCGTTNGQVLMSMLSVMNQMDTLPSCLFTFSRAMRDLIHFFLLMDFTLSCLVPYMY